MKRFLFLLIFSVFCLATVRAQEADRISVSNVDQSAEFPGGRKAMLKFFAENVVYPEEALKQDIQGCVRISATIDKDGSVKNVEVVESVHPLLDAEAVRVVKQMPKWNPEMMDGKPMSVTQTIPVTFKIPNPVNFGVNEHTVNDLDSKPEFPGGIEASKKYIAENLIYPEEAKRQGIRGRVLVVTGIDRDGTVKVLGIEKSVHPLLDEEAKRVISSMPKWKPGIKDGKPMRLKTTIPVNFGVAEHTVNDLDSKPEFPGGIEASKKYIAENLIYPEEAKRQGIRGRVLVVTGIDRDGTVKVLGIEKSVHPLLDEEAKRVISSMPKWKPGIKDGKPMRLKITIPVNFGVAEHSIDELDRKPEFPGGYDVCIKYLAVNVKYPKEAAKRKIQGRVIVDFVVNRDGSITDANVVKSVHYLLDEEALRVVKTMPKWNPGILDGKPVRVKYSLPINFKIPESPYSK